MRDLLKKLLSNLSRKVIQRYHPIVIGVTGSVGKTTTKEAIFSVLAAKFYTRKTEKNFNAEIGTPLSILGIKPFYDSPPGEAGEGATLSKKFKFIFDVLGAAWLAYGFRQKYPEVLVLELGADRPGDIEHLAQLTKPLVGVVTAVGDIPVHVEFYSDPGALANEKANLIKALPPKGVAILNYDDQTVLSMKEYAKGKIITFGFNEKADIWASDVSYFLSDDERDIGGLSFKVHKVDSFVPVRVNHLVGAHQIYALLAAIAVGSHFGINIIDAANALEYIDLPKGRMNLIRGIKNSYIIDDTYNASPVAMHAALDTLREFGNSVIALNNGKSRKVAILGDMKELGKYEMEAHKNIGALAAERCDLLITVGTAAKSIAEEAQKNMSKEQIKSFSTADEAKEKISEIIQEGDVILIKGSRSMKMEKIVETLVTF